MFEKLKMKEEKMSKKDEIVYLIQKAGNFFFYSKMRLRDCHRGCQGNE